MRQQIIERVEKEKLIAIVRGVGAYQCRKVAQALYEGGVRLMEITYDQRAPETWAATAGAIGALAQEYAGRMFVGAGTVTCVIRRTRELGMVSMPGALTPTEIMTAHNAGADFVKLFPAGELGSGYIKAVRAPISHVKLMAVGGINEGNAAAFLKAGAVGLGVGGNLAKRAWIEAGEFDKLTEAARAMTAAVASAAE